MRRHTHAGSWYDDDADSLQNEIEEALFTDEEVPLPPPKYIISPHAGYTYSLKTAATAYRRIDVAKIATIFILGPSHYASLRGCGVDTFSSLQTPIGVLQVDTDITEKLLNEDGFVEISRVAAEREHSIEMQLPILRQILNRQVSIYHYRIPFRACADHVKFVPIMVGSMDAKRLEKTGTLQPPTPHSLSRQRVASLLPKQGTTQMTAIDETCGRIQCLSSLPIFATLETGYENESIPLWQAIKKLDMDAVDYIIKHDLDGFREYLEETGNTICGCNAIKVLLMLIKLSGMSIRSEMISYTQVNHATAPCIAMQSNKCEGIHDCSVSYCSIAGVES
ncbi:hypothetical protein, conserved [Babesia bigemina]|uniref:Uncharacterized protein n=1 Tax=Babesia bigemina TaxID=5866 RepID=A0A061D5N9_BABBI|nr:hypothetical protein, conserved [Babesia bigemina]CDR95312.1 hypothetical protein, conserved [Babesia bigemina]|eukprot:XP_012767498.1 hypothetical protein, conserved [Babesia bigemina]